MIMSKAPGKSYRKGLTLLEIADMFGDEEKARQWIEDQATIVPVTDAPHVAGFVASQTQDGAKVYTDEAKAYNALKPCYDHETVNHSDAEYVREQDTIDQMADLEAGMVGKRLQFADLIADNGLASGARS